MRTDHHRDQRAAPAGSDYVHIRKRSLVTVLVIAAGVAVLVAGAVIAVNAFLNSQIPPRAAVAAHCAASTDLGVASLDPEQSANAALIAAVGQSRGMSPRAVTIALATAMQESDLRNIDYGDRDSLGLFQQRPSQDWGTAEQIMDPLYAANEFYRELEKVSGFEDMAVTEAAQAVQRSAYPDAYADHETDARSFASTLTGHSPAGLICVFNDAPKAVGPDGFLSVFRSEWGDGPADRATAKEAKPADGTKSGEPATVTLRGSSDTEAWAYAAWATAKADQLGIDSIEVDGRRWERQSGAWAPAPSPTGPNGETKHGVIVQLA
jgi:hypothetical protein